MRELTKDEKRFVELVSEANYTEEHLKEIAATADAMVNNFGFHRTELCASAMANEIARQNMIAMSCAWIAYWAKQPEYRFDGRNKYAGMLCRSVAEISEFSKIAEHVLKTFSGKAYTEMIETPFSKYGSSLATMHKTLMQTFTGFILKCIAEMPDFVKVAAAMREEYCDDFYVLPFI